MLPSFLVLLTPVLAALIAATDVACCQSTPEPPPGVSRSANDGAITTRKDARTITLKIPAPRGQIVDRNGDPLAQNQVAFQAALQFPHFENADRDFVVRWARSRVETLVALLPNISLKSDDDLYDHYRHRRWLPLMLSGQLSEKEARRIEAKLSQGLALVPIYRRFYPQGELAAHLLGYTGSVGKLPTGPINFNEPLWEESEGRSGFEKLFNDRLTGEPGVKKMLFDENGNKLLEELVKRPKPGGTLVTTIDLKWQKLAEKTLRNGCRRGAFVVIDVATGEVLVMASRPSFDLNRFVPGISTTEFQELEQDPSQPLFGRAFQSAYPPASSYKPIVALAALNQGVVTENSTIDCPAAIQIGKTVFNNWSKNPEGSINVKRAIARSCNTWFYQVGIDTGPTAFLSLSRKLGFGEKSGLPLIGESPGLVPNDDWMLKYHRRRILDGDTANLSIGQGALLASPLQVAQAMAGLANGGALPKLQLIRQVQDIHGRVLNAPLPERRNWLGIDPKAVEVVHQGMSDVVNGPGGTGRSAALSFTSLCGKTGTAQWGPKSKNQRLAWFAGFLPADNPRYSFAVLYEGRPGEKVSGGRMAAPMVRYFFESIKDDIKEIIAPPQKALVVVEDPSETTQDPNATTLKALPVMLDENGNIIDTPPPTSPPPAQPPSQAQAPPPTAEPDPASTPQPPARAIPVEDEEVLDENIE